MQNFCVYKVTCLQFSSAICIASMWTHTQTHMHAHTDVYAHQQTESVT